MEWKVIAGAWTARGPSGCIWKLIALGNGVLVMPSEWDRQQSLAPTLEAAKAHAEELDARPPIPPQDWTDQPVLETEGEPFEAYPDAVGADPPPRVAICEWCESEAAPHPVRPMRQTAPWWIDPEPFWRCPDCGSSRGDVFE